MTERYPFFRDEDETTLAVIGEEAIASDLDGVYQKPYAVLTQQRLYCKGERLSRGKKEQGNFIVNSSDILSAVLPTQGNVFRGVFWAMIALYAFNLIVSFLKISPQLIPQLITLFVSQAHWDPYFYESMFWANCVFACATYLIGLPAVVLAVILYYRHVVRGAVCPLIVYAICQIIMLLPTSAFSFLLTLSPNGFVFIPPIALIVLGIFYLVNARESVIVRVFSILSKNGDAFPFDPKDYPAEEFSNFTRHVEQIKAGAPSGTL